MQTQVISAILKNSKFILILIVNLLVLSFLSLSKRNGRNKETNAIDVAEPHAEK